MKKILLLLVLALLNSACSSNRQFFNDGKVTTSSEVEEIKIDVSNNIPLCKVQINGREYTFMVDTGAPTVISEAIFEDLNLKKHSTLNASDSQDNNQKLKFVNVPEMRIGNLVVNDIGCGVLNLDANGLHCFGVDGIVGANLMAKLVLEFDYPNQIIRASTSPAHLGVEKSDFSWSFTTSPQKTPKVTGNLLGRNLSFTFDTGFNGNLDIPNDYEFYKSKVDPENFVTDSGIGSIGVYGSGKPETSFSLKTTLELDGISFADEVIGSGKSPLIGNSFLKDYVFTIDWQQHKIYFKKNLSRRAKSISGFGFSYMFIDGKPMVISKIEDKNIPVNLGDEILSINDFDFSKIDSTEVCKYWLNRVENGFDKIVVRVRRNQEELTFTLEKTIFLK